MFLTVHQASAETGYSVSYLRKLLRDGLLPHFKGEGNNGRLLIRTDELLAFMETRRVVTPSVSTIRHDAAPGTSAPA